MSDEKPTFEQAGELARRLQKSLARRRPRPWLPVTAALIGSVVLLAALTWWLYPRPKPEVLQVLAFDGVFTADETPKARAQLLLAKDDSSVGRLRDQTLKFHEPYAAKPGAKIREQITTSDAEGKASVDWLAPPPPATLIEYNVLYINLAQQKGSSSTGRLGVWPKDAPLLVVDADETLNLDEVEAEAQAKLHTAAEEGWHIVYLILAPAEGRDFLAARNKLATQTKLPAGPVLGRRHYPASATNEQAQREILQDLKGRFQGKLAAVVKGRTAAEISQEAGFDTIMLSEDARPAEVLHVAGWADVPVRLK